MLSSVHASSRLQIPWSREVGPVGDPVQGTSFLVASRECQPPATRSGCERTPRAFAAGERFPILTVVLMLPPCPVFRWRRFFCLPSVVRELGPSFCLLLALVAMVAKSRFRFLSWNPTLVLGSYSPDMVGFLGIWGVPRTGIFRGLCP